MTETKNVYVKYCPNVFLAECTQPYEKDDTVILTTKYGKENECVIHNLIFQKNGKFYYSITRADGFNSQERAKNRADKLQGYAANAENRSTAYYEASHEGPPRSGLRFPMKM